MIIEHAILPVHFGEEADFESAFEPARPLISSQPSFRHLSLSRSIESLDFYLLVEWDSIEAHTDGAPISCHFRAESRIDNGTRTGLDPDGVRAWYREQSRT